MMDRVYLDQNKWIDLSRAQHGRPGGQRFKDALDVCTAGVDRGLVSLPLSVVRYIETYRRAENKSRERLGRTMAELSRFHAIAPQTVILHWEIDVALSRLTNSEPPAAPRIFGIGVAHAFGVDPVKFEPPPGARLPPGARAAIRQSYSTLMEHLMLYGPHDSMTEDWQTKVRENAFGQQYADFESGLSERAVAEKFAHGSKMERLIMATEVSDIRGPIAHGLARAGVSVDDFFAMGRDEITSFILSMPSRNVTYNMRLARHRNRQKEWSANDLNDVTSLATAVPYCDIVVTEKSWVHTLTQAGLDREYGTRILSDAGGLVDALIAA